MARSNIPCPFEYANGKRCGGDIVKVEAYNADLEWELQEDGSSKFSFGHPRSHYHVFCSEKGNHAGFGRSDSDSLGPTEPFAVPLRTAEQLRDFSRPWFVAGGWAIDLHLGQVTRESPVSGPLTGMVLLH